MARRPKWGSMGGGGCANLDWEEHISSQIDWTLQFNTALFCGANGPTRIVVGGQSRWFEEGGAPVSVSIANHHDHTVLSMWASVNDTTR